MKTNKYLAMMLLSSSLAFLPGCDSMLDLEPETEATDAVAFYKAEDFKMAVNNCYMWMPKASGTDVIRGIMFYDENADYAWYNTSNPTPVSESSYTTASTDKLYDEYYKRVRHINQIFANQSKMEASAIAQYIAEAHFFRGFASFLFFADFGPGTICRELVDVQNPELFAARATREDFANFIIEDLEAAVNSGALPKQSELGSTDNGRITLGAAQAMLARFCLFEGTWHKFHESNGTNDARATELLTKAKKYADLVMADNSYKLFRNEEMGDLSYKYMFTLESSTQCNIYGILKDANTEYILRNRFDESLKVLNENAAHAVPSVIISRKMVETYLTKEGKIRTPQEWKTAYTGITREDTHKFFEGMDPRLAMNVGIPYDLAWGYANGRTTWTDEDDTKLKPVEAMDVSFVNRKWCPDRQMSDSKDWGIDIPIIRLAEVYLIFAEATYELNGTLTQDEINRSLNKLRERVGMADFTVPEGSDMRTEIRRERAVELYMEGFRYDDLRRWKRAEIEMSASLEGVPYFEGSAFTQTWTIYSPYAGKDLVFKIPAEGFNQTADGYLIKQESSKRQFTSKYYLKPLPLEQLKLNDKLVQNDGWETK